MEQNNNKTRSKYNIEEYAQKARKALDKLREEKQPGEKTGTGGKTEVLSAVKPEIERLIKEGYTAQQIADALQNDVFRILPKTITQMMNPKARKPRKPKTQQKTDTPPAPAPHTDTKQARQPAPGTFTVTPDSDDL